MKTIISLCLFLCISKFGISQREIDLSIDNGNTTSIDLDVTSFKIINAVKNVYTYKVETKNIKLQTLPFDVNGIQSSDSSFDMNNCSPETKKIIKQINDAKTEKEMKKAVEQAKQYLQENTEGAESCIKKIKEFITDNSEIPVPIKSNLGYNQQITVTVKKFKKDSQDPVGTWTFIFKTPEKARWLVHYGLTYAPSKISKVDHYHSFADTSIANRYTIKKDNNNGPKAWDNISATINFTYPFSSQSRDFDLGFTTGFGISTGLGLSGQAGLSAIIGENVILSSGIVMMQKQKLKGQYSEGQIIKENLAFDALHEKVWLPELFFTIGFRFGSNPFAAKSTDTPKSTTNTKPTP